METSNIRVDDLDDVDSRQEIPTIKVEEPVEDGKGWTRTVVNEGDDVQTKKQRGLLTVGSTREAKGPNWRRRWSDDVRSDGGAEKLMDRSPSIQPYYSTVGRYKTHAPDDVAFTAVKTLTSGSYLDISGYVHDVANGVAVIVCRESINK